MFYKVTITDNNRKNLAKYVSWLNAQQKINYDTSDNHQGITNEQKAYRHHFVLWWFKHGWEVGSDDFLTMITFFLTLKSN